MPEMVERDRDEPTIDESVDLGGIDPLGLVDALATVAARTATSQAPGRLAELGWECLKIALGRSSVAPKPRDWRFTNRAWSEHPFYHRLMQTYLAWDETVERLVEDADLDWRTEERARFAASLLTSTVAPTNHPLLNPDAIERAWETAGKSVVRGLRNFGLDVTTNNGLPRSIAPGAFEVGKTLAATPGAVVHANEVYELLQYNPSTPAVRARPVVVVPPQINKYYVMDLAPGRSFIEYARDRGFQVFAVSWRNPTPEQSGWGLGTYVDALGDAVRTANEIASSDGVSTVGACAGGITTAALLGHLAWTAEPLVRSATFAVTHLDYDVRAMIGMFGTRRLVDQALAKSKGAGVLDRVALGAIFSLLRPNDLVWNYWVRNNLMGDEPPRFDVLAWNSDGTAIPAALHADFLDMFLHNSMARSEMKLLGSPIDLHKVDCDSMVVGARTDHLVPWRASYATTRLLGGTKEFVLSSSGHIQSLVSPPGTPKMTITTGPEPVDDPDAWLAEASERQGVWWERWAEWQAPRAGGERKAPASLGSRAHPPNEAAPGSYVRNG